ncbi:MAG: electron transfer flavoprotein subunit alpha/FixB family protein [Deltaproteobacteria bacterium]|nr:electron transfer flavoprotein subunit alpha/FixB family protein [Deltaproteobacteria bacterium]
MSILVIAEVSGGKLRKATLNAVTFARQLAAARGDTVAIGVLGAGVGGAAAEAAAFGPVHVVDAPALATCTAGTWAGAVADLAGAVGANAVAATSSTFSRDLLPRVAARLGAGMVSEVVAVTPDGRFKRPMWAGNVVATVEVKTPKAVFTVRSTEFALADPAGAPGAVAAAAVTVADDGKAKVVSFAPTVSARPDLGEAKVVVSGGRGLKDKEGWKVLDPLADLFGAAVGATRAVVDAGIVPNDLQVGQTGKVVAPNLYFAVALSGAIQHIAGMKASKVIVAINKDEEAPIFSVADYGLVGDAFKVVPEMIEEIKRARAG